MYVYVAVVGARVIRGRLPAIGRQDGAILRHGPPPGTRAAERAVGGAEPWPQVHPGVDAGRARRRACEWRVAATGWRVPAEPTMPRLDSQASG